MLCVGVVIDTFILDSGFFLVLSIIANPPSPFLGVGELLFHVFVFPFGSLNNIQCILHLKHIFSLSLPTLSFYFAVHVYCYFYSYNQDLQWKENLGANFRKLKRKKCRKNFMHLTILIVVLHSCTIDCVCVNNTAHVVICMDSFT